MLLRKSVNKDVSKDSPIGIHRWKIICGNHAFFRHNQRNVCMACLQGIRYNPLNLNSDQHKISPSKSNAYLTPEVIRIKDMITQGEFSRCFNNFSSLLLKENYEDKIREFVP